ncbi:hypothetical protein [Tamlana flava]|uniref:hypothetical protein n=1 Tax=Tamlana flava TaxID=3158572 RepID=UPI00351B2B8C
MKSNYLMFFFLFAFVLVYNCKNEKKEQINIEQSQEQVKEKKDNYIEIVTNVMDFQSMDTIPSGWNTFKYINKSTQAHFFLLDKYPEGKNIQNTIAEVGPPFDNGMEFIMKGDMDKAMAEFGKLPEWFGQIVFTGGSGLVSPGQTSITTVKLLPGLYIMECYVKMADGKFHTSMGMAKEIHVLEEDSGNEPPKADIDITISSTDGITYSSSIKKGNQVFAVHYKDQIVHENFVGHDVNLVKLDANADLEMLEAWMNWATPTGLMDPLPEGITFLGGTNDAPAGSTQYFEVDLTPGKYAFISEVPNTSSKNMLKTFEVLNQ